METNKGKDLPLLRILLIEDNEHDRMAFRRAFKKVKITYDIKELIRAEEALETLSVDTSQFDIIVADYMLPGMNGLELCEELIKKNVPIALVILTGAGSEDVAVEALKAGVDDYIAKDLGQGYLKLLPVVLPDVVRRYGDKIKRKQAEEALQKSEEKYRFMLESMVDSVYICSPYFRLEFMNSAMIKRIGRDATGEVCHKVIHDLDKKCPWCVIEKVMQGEYATSTVVCPKDKRSYDITHSPIANGDGSISKLAIFRDITERKQAEEEHIKRVKLQAVIETAGAACHELNQPMQTISGYSELLSMGISEKNPLYEKVGKIKEQIDRMGKITAKLMGITRYETKVYSGEKKIINLDAIERRKYKRFITSIRAFVIPKSDSPKQHQIIDISMDGLAFWCNEIQDQLDEFNELSINMTDGNFYLDNIPCKTISDLTIADESHPGSVSMKRCGVRFGDLSPNQTDQLDYFIKNHTITN